MSSEWSRLTLKEAGIVLIDCDHRTPSAADEGYPYIAIPQLKNGHIELAGARRISQADYIDWTKKLKPQADDVVVVRRCNSGDSAHVPAGLDCAIGQNLVVLRASGDRVIPSFLRWLLKGPEWWDQVSKFVNVGAVFDSLRCRDIPNFELTIPPVDQQAEIASTLVAIDDRITLLRETNATLEAAAQLLFRSWFVDFDPVRAKAEGFEPVGMDVVTAALFPISFEESELGLVPRGWKVMPFSETIDVIGGGTPKTAIADYWDGNIPWFSVVDAPSTSDVFVINTEKNITIAGLENSSTKLLSAGTTIISARGTVGRLALVGQEMAMNQSCYGLRGRALDSYFTYFNTYRLVESLKRHAHGSVFDTITRKTLSSVYIVYPPEEIIYEFENTISPLMERIKENQKQAKTLTQLLDTLLPRLISGQIRLPAAEEMIEEACA